MKKPIIQIKFEKGTLKDRKKILRFVATLSRRYGLRAPRWEFPADEAQAELENNRALLVLDRYSEDSQVE